LILIDSFDSSGGFYGRQDLRSDLTTMMIRGTAMCHQFEVCMSFSPTEVRTNRSFSVKKRISTMKFSLCLLAASVTATSGFFVNKPQPALIDRSSTALFDSRRRQKVAKFSKWLEKRGGEEGEVAAAGGLMTNAEGLEYIKLVHPETGASSEIYLLGGVVTSYKADGTEFIAVRPDAKMDGSKPISGGLSHCWPQFGPGEIQQHGFARNLPWTVKSQTDTSVELELAPSDYTKAMWDKEFLCTFSVNLEADQLSTKMLVENKGEESFDFQAALHSYFAVSSLDNLEIAGSFVGKEFLNKMVGEGEMQTEEREAITISEEYDRVYKGVNDPVLKDSGTGKALAVLNTAGYEDTVLWSPFGNEGMGYNTFVCVESAKFDAVTLDGGASWAGDMALKPSAL
jgi:glucose-6-phosphate 1-epimerase